jgi:hypothetical protein
MRWLAPHSGWAGAGDPNEGLMISMNHFPVEKMHLGGIGIGINVPFPVTCVVNRVRYGPMAV